jgi:hypothetical protein
VIAVILALLVAGAGVFYVLQNDSFWSSFKMYSNDTYGISFTYPARYALQERNPGTSDVWLYEIALVDTNGATNIPADWGQSPNITIDIYQNDFNNRRLENWVRNSQASNFTRSVDGLLPDVTVAGVSGLFYHWKGLYSADTYALPHRNNVILLTVTFNSRDDQIHQDFTDIVTSLKLQ